MASTLVKKPVSLSDVMSYHMPKRLKPIPRFKNEAEEREFWETHDTEGLIDWTTARRVSFPNLKLSTVVSPVMV